MSAEAVLNLESMARQAEASENNEAHEQEKTQPGYESIEERREVAREKAMIFVGGLELVLGKIAPQSAQEVMTDPKCEDGIDKLEAVLLKYPDTGMPGWMASLMVYKEEFMAGAWFAGVVWGVYKNEKLLKAEREEEARKAQEAEDRGDES